MAVLPLIPCSGSACKQDTLAESLKSSVPVHLTVLSMAQSVGWRPARFPLERTNAGGVEEDAAQVDHAEGMQLVEESIVRGLPHVCGLSDAQSPSAGERP